MERCFRLAKGGGLVVWRFSSTCRPTWGGGFEPLNNVEININNQNNEITVLFNQWGCYTNSKEKFRESLPRPPLCSFWPCSRPALPQPAENYPGFSPVFSLRTGQGKVPESQDCCVTLWVATWMLNIRIAIIFSQDFKDKPLRLQPSEPGIMNNAIHPGAPILISP